MRRRETARTWMIFLSCIPARKMCCLSASGWKVTTCGRFPFEKALMHCPVGSQDQVSFSAHSASVRRESRTRLGIPELHLLVVTGREEPRSVVVERDVLDRLRMAHKRPEAVPLVVNVPELEPTRHQMTDQRLFDRKRRGKTRPQPDEISRLTLTLESMDPLRRR